MAEDLSNHVYMIEPPEEPTAGLRAVVVSTAVCWEGCA